MSTGKQQEAERLRADIEAELSRTGQVVAALGRAAGRLGSSCSDETRMAVAGYLHGAYTGCEAVMARVARAFDEMPTGERWHQALLMRSAAPHEGVRPPLISPETGTALLELLRFRHFFRNAYGVELRPDKLAAHAAEVPPTFERFAGEVRAFLACLVGGDS